MQALKLYYLGLFKNNYESINGLFKSTSTHTHAYQPLYASTEIGSILAALATNSSISTNDSSNDNSLKSDPNKSGRDLLERRPKICSPFCQYQMLS